MDTSMPITRNPQLSSLYDAIMKQGIVSILGPDCAKTKTTSIRRTLSADMSYKKWLHQNGFKSSSFSLQGEDHEHGKLQKLDIISSYVHPLVKRSSSCLSEKSLEFCTENIGSETGSDGFCSESFSDAEIKELNPPPPAARKLPVRSFPPPLSFIAGGEWPSLEMNSRRENGRLILEAVFVPPRNIFQARRRDGRLVLSFVNSSGEDEEETADDEGGGGGCSPVEKFEEGNVAEEVGFLMRGKKTEHFVSYLRGCNGLKTSLLITEPCCVATS